MASSVARAVLRTAKNAFMETLRIDSTFAKSVSENFRHQIGDLKILSFFVYPTVYGFVNYALDEWGFHLRKYIESSYDSKRVSDVLRKFQQSGLTCTDGKSLSKFFDISKFSRLPLVPSTFSSSDSKWKWGSYWCETNTSLLHIAAAFDAKEIGRASSD